MEYNSINNYDQIGEYIKALRNLENELQKKEYDLSSITNLYQNLKKLNISLSQECQNLNEKNIALITEKKELKSKYDIELENIKLNFTKKENEYQQKISNLSSFNIDSLKNKIESDIMTQYQEKIFAKDQEILEQKKIIDDLQQKNELILEQFQFEKNGLLKDINTLKNLHKTETNDLIQRIQMLKNNNYSNNITNDEQILKTKNELQTSKHQINILTNENFRLKKENEFLMKEKNKLKGDNMILEGKIKFEEKKNETEIKKLNNYIDNLKMENNNLKNNNNEKNNEIQTLYHEKVNLNNNLSNKEIESQKLLNEINVLNDLLKVHQEEIENNIIQNNKNKKENILKERLNEERYQKEIDDLKSKLDNKTYLDNLENIISDKNDKIQKLKKKIKEQDRNFEKKYNDILKKKNFYKMKCKDTNEKIEKMIKKLSPEQENEFRIIFNNEQKNNNILEISGNEFHN